MNWLAHTFLSEPDSEFRLGNLLADVIKRQDRDSMSPRFQEGMHRHKLIDAYTDSHPIVHRSRARIRGDYRHTRGIIVDLFYDHFLSIAWDRYCELPLPIYAAGVYRDIESHSARLPEKARLVAGWMVQDDRLASYGAVDGIESALQLVSQRLSKRLGKPFALQSAVSELHEKFEELQGDFAEFFPQLRAHLDDFARAEILTGRQ